MGRRILNFSLVLLIQLITINTWAQDLFVYHITGKVHYSDLSQHNEQAFYNYKILPSTVFKLEEKSELILRDNDYNLLLVKSKGSYSAKNLIDLFKNRGKEENFTRKTIEFISSELVRSDEDIREYADNYLKQSGGVSRGNCIGALMISPINGQVLSASVLLFTWEGSPSNISYEFRITDESPDLNDERILFYTKVQNATELSIDVDSLSFLKENESYSWSVNPIKEPNCASFYFIFTSKERIKILKNSLVQSIDTSQTITDQLVELASLYENNGLLQEAIACYDLAFTLTENQAFLTLAKLTIARHQ